MTSTSNSWFSFSYDQILLALSPTHAIYNWYAKPSDSEMELPVFTLALTYRPDKNDLTSFLQPEAPAIAPSAFGLSIISIIRSFIWNDEMIQKGYDEVCLYKYIEYLSPFYDLLDDSIEMDSSACLSVGNGLQSRLVNTFTKWLARQIRYCPSRRMLELESLAGPALSQDMMHLSVIKTLNRHLDAVYLEILDETKYGFDKIFTPIEADSD
ncbi:11442_t:CDS:2, partial [Acaulospora colombiana]